MTILLRESSFQHNYTDVSFLILRRLIRLGKIGKVKRVKRIEKVKRIEEVRVRNNNLLQ